MHAIRGTVRFGSSILRGRSQKLRYATSWPPGSIGADAAKLYAEAVSEYSEGEISVKVYPMTLLNAAETSSGVRDGMADIGFVFAGYFLRSSHTSTFLMKRPCSCITSKMS